MNPMRPPEKLLVAMVLAVLLAGASLPAARASDGDDLEPATFAGNAPSAAGAALTGEGVRLLSANAEGATFEVRVPWEQLDLQQVTADDRQYVRVSLPGWSATAQPGAPWLPLEAQTIGVPFGAVLNVRAEPGPAHTIALPAPALPVATQRVEWDLPSAPDGIAALPAPTLTIEEDPAVYSGGAPYPGTLAEVASDGVVRQQRVVGIVVYPVQYNPATREITVYEWLRVQVVFEGAAATDLQAAAPESAAYEAVFRQELLNYDAARAWRQSGAGASAAAASGPWTPPEPWPPPVPGWRVKVREEGMYKLTYAELAAAGLPVGSLDPRTFRLFNLGNEVAIYVSGEGDGVFDGTDFLLFYGQPVASKYTRDNVYWLTYGQGPGLRMGSRSGAPGDAPVPAYYPAQRHMESNNYYVAMAPGSEDLERWLWDYINTQVSTSWTHTFALATPSAESYSGKLTVAMLGYLRDNISPDHHATISLNGTQVGEAWWDGVTWKTLEIPVAQGLLVAGNNTLRITCPNDTGVGRDVLYIDWAELKFANRFVAQGNVLPFHYETSGTWKFQVDGFSTDRLAVYDVSDPWAVARITDISVLPSALGYALQFQDTIATPTDYWAMADAGYRTVQAIEADTPSNLQSTTNGADHIIIYHREFAAQAAQLRDWRAAQGLRAMMVDVEDVYDEFGYGVTGAMPIHDFLAFAYAHWQAPAPSYVVLVGDGSYDPKDYLNQGRLSYMPPYLAPVDPSIVETAADNRYVTVSGYDAMPDIMLGRLAVNSSAEASAFVQKIIAYEQSPVSGDWKQQVLAVADNADSAGNFAQMSDNVLTRLREPYQAQKVYYGVTHTTVTAARTAILAGINAGKLIVNYFGHAAQTQWADEGLFKASDVAGLTNGGKLPVMLPMTCYDGYFHYPTPKQGYDATAEVVTRAQGKGAVASWSPTGLGVASGHDRLDQGFFQAVFQQGLPTLGQATSAGKLALWSSGVNLDLLDTYLLFGDPALRLPLTLYGDLDGDCDVDIVDIMLVAGRWNSSVGDPNYDARYDLDGDGVITVVDIMLVAARWGTRCAQ